MSKEEIVNPMKSTISIAELASAMGLVESRIRQMCASGVLPKSANSQLPAFEAVCAVVEIYKKKQTAKGSSDERIKKARAEKLELANEATKRDLIPAEEVRREVTRAFQELKGQLLIIPRRMGQPLALESDPVSVEEKLHAEIVSALENQRLKELQQETNK